MVSSYRELTVWQRAMELVERIFLLTSKLPREQVYGLSAQTQRAAVSVASNIAEGHARESTREYLHFPSTSLGSLAEREMQLILCERLEFLSADEGGQVLGVADEVGKMIRGVQRGLKEKLNWTFLSP